MPLKTFQSIASSKKLSDYIDPALVILYNYLRKTYKKLRMTEIIVPVDVEVDFIQKSAYAYERMGCPALALRIIQTSPLANLKVEIESESGVSKLNAASGPKFDWSEPVSNIKSSNGIDWGEPISNIKSISGIDWSEPVSNIKTSNGIDWGEPVSNLDFPDTFKSTLEEIEDPVNSAIHEQDRVTFVDPKTYYRYKILKRSLFLYKWQLAMRLIQV